jgi:hypothetical protein
LFCITIIDLPVFKSRHKVWYGLNSWLPKWLMNLNDPDFRAKFKIIPGSEYYQMSFIFHGGPITFRLDSVQGVCLKCTVPDTRRPESQ